MIALILIIGIGSLIGIKLYENSNKTGNLYAKITYQNELILMVDLVNNDYIVYDTIYKNSINTDRATEGIFYVPGKVTDDMRALYEEDIFARDNDIVGIKLLVEDNKISVTYQESPKDLCQLQSPTDSHLRPIICLPNELVIDVYTDLNTNQFIPDSVLE